MPPTSTATGPELLDERTLGGILVHPLAFLTGFLGAAIVYAVSNHEYTRANARHALNWHVTVFLLSVVAFAAFFLGADERTIAGETVELALLPAPLDAVVAGVGFLLLLATVVAWILTFVFAVVATLKATFGSAWKYPGAIDIVARYR